MSAPIFIDFEQFREPGLYLLFEDGLILTLTRGFIEKMKQRYRNDPQLLPPSIRNAPAYQPCSVCPKRETAQICHVIPTVFPFVEDMDRFLSSQRVMAVFRAETADKSEPTDLHIGRMPVQRALQYVSILSLMYYCEVGLLYYKYFEGVLPIMSPLEIVERVYLNIFWDLAGNQKAIQAMISKMRHDMDVTMAC